MALLDFFNSPNAALAAGLLSPNQGGSFGTSLLSGIQASQAARQNNTQDQLGQLRAQIAGQGINDASAFRQNLQGLALPHGLQPQNSNQVNAASGLLNALAPPTTPTSEFERLDALVQSGQATPGQIARHKRLTSENQGMTLSLEGLFENAKAKGQGTNFAKATETSVIEAGKVRAFEGATNEVLKGLVGGAPIGTVASFIGGLDVVRSQFNQATGSQAALEDQISGLSADNQGKVRTLIGQAISGSETASQTMSLVYLLAGGRENGKLSDTDLKLAIDSIESGSTEQMVAKLVSTKNGLIGQFNQKQRTNRDRLGEDPAFASMEGDKVFTAEAIRNAPDSVINGFRNMNTLAIEKMLSDDELDALVSRMKAMTNGQ